MQSVDPSADRDFIRVAPSPIQGQGVFAKRDIPRGTRVIEYTGERRSLESLVRDSSNGGDGGVYLAHLHRGVLIDGSRNGNDARFVNHSCDPNCELYMFEDHLYIYAMQDIVEGEELTFDYQLDSPSGLATVPERDEGDSCSCGSTNCRGSMRRQATNKRSER